MFSFIIFFPSVFLRSNVAFLFSPSLFISLNIGIGYIYTNIFNHAYI